MRAEDETRHDPEVAAAAAAARPEQIGVVVLVCDEDLAVGGDDLHRDEIVGCEPPGPRGEPEAAAECMAADADGRARARGNREPVRGETVVDVPEPGARPDDGVTARDRDAGQLREVDDHAAGHCRVAAVAVAARAGDDVHAGLRRPLDRGGDIGGVERLHDRERMDAVVEAVEDQPRALVPGRAAREDRPAHGGRERLEPRVGGR